MRHPPAVDIGFIQWCFFSKIPRCTSQWIFPSSPTPRRSLLGSVSHWVDCKVHATLPPSLARIPLVAWNEASPTMAPKSMLMGFHHLSSIVMWGKFSQVGYGKNNSKTKLDDHPSHFISLQKPPSHDWQHVIVFFSSLFIQKKNSKNWEENTLNHPIIQQSHLSKNKEKLRTSP